MKEIKRKRTHCRKTGIELLLHVVETLSRTRMTPEDKKRRRRKRVEQEKDEGNPYGLRTTRKKKKKKKKKKNRNPRDERFG